MLGFNCTGAGRAGAVTVTGRSSFVCVTFRSRISKRKYILSSYLIFTSNCILLPKNFGRRADFVLTNPQWLTRRSPAEFSKRPSKLHVMAFFASETPTRFFGKSTSRFVSMEEEEEEEEEAKKEENKAGYTAWHSWRGLGRGGDVVGRGMGEPCNWAGGRD